MSGCNTAFAVAAVICIAAATVAGAAAAAGSAASGRAVYEKQCLVCHDTAPEYHKEGPSLSGVYGRRAGTAPFFAGYKGLKGADFIWDTDRLDRWLADPRSFLQGRNTGMTLIITDPGQRADLIAYMKTLR
ncbi:MAG TPA: c-type cytochrome [Rhodospirillales bacterium]|nr:c-type cytochrome [Rhodospirillales bacterium]